ncbi:hypothetical protein EJF36_19520 [Bacillus sp. HMF5848]|uniref:hypothetical protein n=1 Tax=Bacillus sp. HMF5848 TaxID=2495421 RepID=UPI000F7A6C45|nr:hypothetical protein [Bacillus sp. HMF5848]RSK28889.1 hypothetical protein EJF36_19520 [Bacillus sp. HMF5848]
MRRWALIDDFKTVRFDRSALMDDLTVRFNLSALMDDLTVRFNRSALMDMHPQFIWAKTRARSKTGHH